MLTALTAMVTAAAAALSPPQTGPSTLPVLKSSRPVVSVQEGGRYQLEMPTGARGIWELRISASRGTELFTQSIRVEFERSHDNQPGREARP